MNEVQMAQRSTVAVRVRSMKPYVLRCFECDWGMTVKSWKAALDVGIEHEAEHAQNVDQAKTD